MKLHQKIPFIEIDSIPDLIKDFLSGNLKGAEATAPLLHNYEAKIRQKQTSYADESRKVLATVLEKQMENLSGSQSANMVLMKENTTFTVTTGHQLNLFTGPVFFVYKILQTIKTASYLKDHFPELNFVPVFWMATEDHDFEEINFFRTMDQHYFFKAASGGAVGRIKVQDTAFISQFESEFKDSVFGTELILMLKESYQPGKTLAEATRILVNRLFADYGLLILDGDDPALKKLMIPRFEEELFQQKLFQESKCQVEFLTEKYGKVQVNPREINLFYLTATRNRIEATVGGFRIVDTDIQFSVQEMREELYRFPEKFSPNALLRPVYQEAVLPNLAYIGGNAEIMYWLELKDYFTAVELPCPVLVPRNSMLFLSQKTLTKISKRNLSVKDFFMDFNQVTAALLMENNAILELLNRKERALTESFDDIKNIAGKTDQSFGNLVQAEEARQLKSYRRMKKRLLRAERIKHYEMLEQLHQLYLQVHPGQTWQERKWNFSVFYADEGHAWLDTCLREMDVSRSELIVMKF